MPFYLRLDGNGSAHGVWEITDAEAYRADMGEYRVGAGTHFAALAGEPIFDAIKRQADSWFEDGSPFHKLTLEPGQYYPRMARPSSAHPNETPGSYPALAPEWNEVAMTRTQLDVLARLLEDIFRTIHPAPENMGAYGHETRNLLILAATEVEAQWRGILAANGITATTTHDYVKLLGAMKLDLYEISLSKLPWLEPIAPFSGWDVERPSQSLLWYDAYNATKHDRAASFSRATLGHAISAVCASVALVTAQYGLPGGLAIGSTIASGFRLTSGPAWSPSEVYTRINSVNWQPKSYPF